MKSKKGNDGDDRSAGEVAYVYVNHLHSDVRELLEVKAASSIRKVRLVATEYEHYGRDDDDDEEEWLEVSSGDSGGSSLERPLRCLRSVAFAYIKFTPDEWFRQDDVERMFGEALPALLTSAPLITRLHFESCDLPTPYFAPFLRRMASPSERQRARPEVGWPSANCGSIAATLTLTPTIASWAWPT